jgi:hypothetical protein
MARCQPYPIHAEGEVHWDQRVRSSIRFVVPKSPGKQPERIVQAINRPTRDTAEAFIYKWSDTREVRPPESKAYAVLNDFEQSISAGVLDAFRNYQIQPVRWSHRGDVVTELAA